MSLFKRYFRFMWGTMLVAVLTAASSVILMVMETRIAMPWWVTPTVPFITVFIGSYVVFRGKEKQVTSKLLSELEDFSKTFHSLTMAGSGEDRDVQIRRLLERVSASDRSREKNLRMHGNHIRDCHRLIERWFKHYEDEVEYFLKHPKSIDVSNTARLVVYFKEIVSNYKTEVIDATIDYANSVKTFPKSLKKEFETSFDVFKNKYIFFGNQFNDYIKRLNKELNYQMSSIEIISRKLELETDKPITKIDYNMSKRKLR